MVSLDFFPSLLDLDTNASNISVKGLPSNVDEQTLCGIFSNFGDTQCCQLVSPSASSNAGKVGYVHLSSPSQARQAINALNGACTDQGTLEVCTGLPARLQTSSDNLYVRNLPTTVSEQELRELFSPCGVVQECRILHRGDEVQGAGALVRMISVEAAAQAIANLNGQLPWNQLRSQATAPLLVRYADGPEEKARKQARKGQLANRIQRPLDLAALTRLETEGEALRHCSLSNNYQSGNVAGAQPFTPGNLSGLRELAANNCFMAEGTPSDASLDALLSGLGSSQPLLPALPQEASAGACSLGLSCLSPSNGQGHPLAPPPAQACASLYVKNLPGEADKLWLYEVFSPYGGILSVKVLQEEHSTRCRGVGFVNFTELQGALSAMQNINGLKVADKHLHVSLQSRIGRP